MRFQGGRFLVYIIPVLFILSGIVLGQTQNIGVGIGMWVFAYGIELFVNELMDDRIAKNRNKAQQTKTPKN